MLLRLLLYIPLTGILIIMLELSYSLPSINLKRLKTIALTTSMINLFISLIMFIGFNFSSNQFQYVIESFEINTYEFFLGMDGLSIYFVLLTTIITPIALLSN